MENQNPQIQPFSAITPSDIQDWKARHGAEGLSEVTIKPLPKVNYDEEGNETTIPGEGPEAKFVIKTPTRSVMDLTAQHGLNKNVTASNKVLINNCVLGGDMEIMERNGAVYSHLLNEINKLVVIKEVEVKKL